MNQFYKKFVNYEQGRKSHLSVISRTRSKQGTKRVITGDQETGKVNQELAGNVKEDEEKVDADKAKDGVDLGD